MYSLVRVGSDKLRVGVDIIEAGAWLEVWLPSGEKVKGQWCPITGRLFGAVCAASGDRAVPLGMTTTARVIQPTREEG